MGDRVPEGKRTDKARKELASLLRTTRLDRGLSGQELADTLGWSQSKVSKIENRRTRPSQEDVRTWLETCRASAQVLHHGTGLAESALVESRHWRAVHSQGMASGQSGVQALEERSGTVRSFQPSLVPGLLQTAGYARQVLTAVDISGQGDTPQAVAARMRRQEALYDADRRFEFTLTESALRWHPHGGEILPAQWDRLLSIATLSNVSLRVLPLHASFGHLQSNGFLLFENADSPTVIVETFTRELLLTDPDEVDQYREIHTRLTEHALPEDDSRDFIRDLATTM
ncbi:transcriptional regulator [Nocardiopsis terrae]|uniref:Transcriptional regulator with XRE-family HTH domain n=1 Tax=Nocardiopsis terrae TaxID=372655 RepID=A0ABR9HFX4_9ACTN|nr:helix-turn-helix transcriptional regulator [Nocardiopsis terrae]MBE1457862.1 transcriptional regulator with XRE-family HTH domain [Nocardiopsis terrae]GHC83861.1 transcriptional regulator [Nocardiopsis terrae]